MSDEMHYATGRRKTSSARVYLKKGKGNISVNDKKLDEYFGRKVAQMLVMQPLELLELTEKIDVNVKVNGGGYSGQADAVRTAIARALVEFTEDIELRDLYMAIDRTLLVNDVRQRESKKWGGPGARARFQKSYR